MNKQFIKFLFLLFVSLSFNALAQEDSIRNLEEVIITATRTEKLLSALPIPVTLITATQIDAMGSLRLNDVLQEQTGIAIVTDHGQGVQIQGFSPDYTLILIDGEPLIGRTAGTLELSRLAVGNIKQIEIVKGPSSSLYGSEALAGVINIITENPNSTNASLSMRYGTNQTTDVGLDVALSKEKWGVSIFANRFASQGYDFTPQTFGQTVEPFQNYTLQSKFWCEISKKLKLRISSRYFTETQSSNFAVNTEKVTGEGRIKERSFNPTLEYFLADKWKLYLRFYHSEYKTLSRLHYQADGKLFEETFFTQTFLRPEMQAEYFLSENHIFTLGVGNIWESVDASRYSSKKVFQTRYFYAQYEWLPTEKWNFIFGGRFDSHTVYGSQISPKLSVQYQLLPNFSLRASWGMGFKAPDFRYLYLNFNNAVAGYSVFGTEELPTILATLQSQGQIAEMLLNPAQIGNLQAETSSAYNIGFQYNPIQDLQWNVNFFRNDVSNLIESQLAAFRTNGQSIFSYVNLNQIFTQGIETDISYNFLPNFCFSAGYQFLEAKDKEVLAQIERGEVFRRNTQTLQTQRVQKEEYGGLFGRSRHMLNLKLFYENQTKGISTNFRAIYRGQYGLGDRNGNIILDDASEYVAGFWTLNFSLSKDFWKKQLRWQLGIDNLTNYRDELNMPALAGRLFWTSLHFNLEK